MSDSYRSRLWWTCVSNEKLLSAVHIPFLQSDPTTAVKSTCHSPLARQWAARRAHKPWRSSRPRYERAKAAHWVGGGAGQASRKCRLDGSGMERLLRKCQIRSQLVRECLAECLGVYLLIVSLWGGGSIFGSLLWWPVQRWQRCSS